MNQHSTVSRTGAQIEIFIKLVGASREFLSQAEKCEDIHVRRSLLFFLPMWLHTQAMSDSLQSRSGDSMWNLPALAALARATMECFVNLAYFCEEVSPAQWELRGMLWDRHLCAKFVEITAARADLSDELKKALTEVALELEEIQEKIKRSAGCNELGDQLARELKKKPDMYLTSSHEDIWVRAGLARADFRYHWKALSQWTHNTPFSICQQAIFAHGEPLSADQISMTIRVAAEMLWRAVVLTPQLEALRDPLEAFRRVYTEFCWTMPSAHAVELQ